MRKPWRIRFLAWVRPPLMAALGAAVLATSSNGAGMNEQARLLDRFEDIGAWTADASNGVKASARSAAGINGRALHLDFDLGRTAGYAFVRRKLPLELPDNFEISFNLRADALPNNFEVKLVDASGDNVWWFERRDFAFPSAWRRIKIKKRQITFAWGPRRTARCGASIAWSSWSQLAAAVARARSRSTT